MRTVGIPAEVKPFEQRVALTPEGVRELVLADARVIVQSGAGVGAGIDDKAYTAAGAQIVSDAEEVWSSADLVCKVKEPQPAEYRYLRDDLTLFTYLHLAAYPSLARALVDAGTTAIAYETVTTGDGELPLLAPMSEIAGRMAVQAGAHHLEAPSGGRGVLLAGAPGVAPASVVVIGAGTVGRCAAAIAVGMQAEVTLLDTRVDRLRAVAEQYQGRIKTIGSTRAAIERVLPSADLVIGAVLVAGARAPVVVPESLVAAMRAGSVIADLAIDQGGCVATARETTHEEPTFARHGVTHYCVGNVPSAVPRTATHALVAATLPYLVSLVRHGVTEACERVPGLRAGLNTQGGSVVHRVVADALEGVGARSEPAQVG